MEKASHAWFDGRGELVDDITQPVRLLLARDMTGDSAGILHVLVSVEHLRDRGRFGAGRIPEMHGEYQRVLARVVVEHGFGRGTAAHRRWEGTTMLVGPVHQ